MTPAQKRKQTILRKIMAENPWLTELQAEDLYKQRQRDIASKGGKNPNSYRGFRDIEVAKRAGRKSRAK